ncbi:MAG: hypothetical protein ABI587_13130 [Gemmatimonadales bacterium]
MRSASLLALTALVLTRQLTAQDFLLRLDTRLQSVAYRGVRLDSVLATTVVAGPNGGLETADGFAVSCAPGSIHCEFYRPGLQRHGGPMVTGADMTAWGFGVRGLSLHANGRLNIDLGNADVWPGTNPALQLFEGYVEYANAWLTGRAGRQTERGRLGYTGFDGGMVTLRNADHGVGGSVYAGFGLARGTALPVTSPALNPLDEFQPRQRELVAGGEVWWQTEALETRLEYQREVDRETRNFVSERAALSATLRPARGWQLNAGSEYDIARGEFGTSDAELRYSRARWSAAGGVRRYQPYFDLWTIWGVFSPVGYTAVQASGRVSPSRWLDLHAEGERYWYSPSAADVPLQQSEDAGWRWSSGAGVTPAAGWYLGLNYRAEFGPGASSVGWDASASWRPTRSLSLRAEGGHLSRPLEFRFTTSRLSWFGGQADLQAGDRLRFSAGAIQYIEDRDRPDAAAFSWNQTRLTAGISWLLGSGADHLPLPPAIRRGGAR